VPKELSFILYEYWKNSKLLHPWRTTYGLISYYKIIEIFYIVFEKLNIIFCEFRKGRPNTWTMISTKEELHLSAADTKLTKIIVSEKSTNIILKNFHASEIVHTHTHPLRSEIYTPTHQNCLHICWTISYIKNVKNDQHPLN